MSDEQRRRERRLDEALRQYAAGEPDDEARTRLDEALDDARWLVDRAPGADTWLLLGQVRQARWELLRDAEDLDGAIALLSQADDPAHEGTGFGWNEHFSLAELLMARFEHRQTTGDLDPAVERLRMAEGILADNLRWMRLRLADVLATRFAVLGRNDDHDEVVGLLGTLAEQVTTAPEVAVQAGHVHLRLGEEMKGMKILAEVWSASEGTVAAEAGWELVLALGNRYQGPDGSPADLDAAIETAYRLIAESRLTGRQSSPTEAECHAVLGVLLMWRSGIGLPEAPDEHDIVLALETGRTGIRNADIDEAVRQLVLAVSLDQGDVESAIVLGVLLLATAAGPNHPAIDALERRLAVLPPDHPLRSRLTGLVELLRAEPAPDTQPGEDRFILRLEAFLSSPTTRHPMRSAGQTFLGATLISRGVDVGDEDMCRRGVAAFHDALERLEPGHPLWRRTVVRLINAMIAMRIFDQGAVDLDRVAALMKDHSDPLELVALELALGWRDSTHAVLSRTVERVTDAMATVTEDPAQILLLMTALPLLVERYLATQNLEYLDLAQRCVQELRSLPGWARSGDDPVEGMSALVDIMQAVARRDGVAAVEAAERLKVLAAEGYSREAGFFAALATAVAEDAAGVDAALAVAAGADREPGPPREQLDDGQRAATAIMKGIWSRDDGELSRGIDLVRRVLAGPESHIGGLTSTAAILGKALTFRHGLGGAAEDLDEAIAKLEEAATERRSNPGAALAAQIFADLSEAHRHKSGGDGPAVDRALESLRARLREVQLQSGTERMLAMSKAGRGEAMRAAGWCIADGRTDALIEALELGRGLVLQAAISVRSVPELLRDAGRHDLATAWESADELRPEVRARAFAVLSDSPLQHPATVGEIAAGLRSVRADALVHLLPGGKDAGGAAVLVRSDETVAVIPLPELRADGPIKRYATAHDEFIAAHGTPAEKEAKQAWTLALTEVCDWAGPAAMGPVLAGLGTGPGSPRLVLVPWELGSLVPWHAARLGDGHACQRAIISYAASGRQLIEAIGRTYRPLLSRPVIVADPVGELMHNSRRECAEIGRLWYPDAARLGRWRHEEARPATVPELMAVLPEVSMLHYSGHASSATWAADSHLYLAGRDGSGAEEKLTINDILRSTGTTARPGAVVVLTACLSDIARESFDEALTLSTALLATVAAGVVGSRWLVADDPRTAVMMAVFHHHLLRTPEDPALALHEARLWMLDPARELPAGIGEPLRRLSAELDFTDIRIWAAFTHQGK
ncbi:CHAT domain-containing protein [Nonomuraea fuscirosea]|uniref:CHAT domain-containing protein n=1 Tax=Nonomuraea fuscirosea TaxID=1291556 RepID=A0A2T0N491_9ACTN|nr:CHAT domain-containing protein [Nonomuraea fuscirosea]PRX66973.1 CHAT domain-containing protein [Nonomuraea fuscirosea]